MTDHNLSVQQADALWDAVAIPGPDRPTFVDQHQRVCRTVAELLNEATAGPRQILDELRALHREYYFGDGSQAYCAHCNQISGGWIPWPCPTIHAIDGELPDPAAGEATGEQP